MESLDDVPDDRQAQGGCRGSMGCETGRKGEELEVLIRRGPIRKECRRGEEGLEPLDNPGEGDTYRMGLTLCANHLFPHFAESEKKKRKSRQTRSEYCLKKFISFETR